MLDLIAKRLGELGCEVSQADSELLLFCKNKVENYIKNYCNLPAVPDGLFEIFVDRICGEFLFLKLESGQLDSESLGEIGIKSVTEGDISVSFSGEGGVRKLIEFLMNCGGGELICYRKIRW